MGWLKRLVRLMRLPKGGKGRVNYGSPAGTFVQYSTMYNCCARCVAPVQQTVVVDRTGMRQSDYILWLN